MSLAADLKVLFHLALSPIRGATHAERLESFYRGQAEDYDAFRRRLLPGRRELWDALPAPPGGRWCDLGGGTGSNLEFLDARLADLEHVYIVDLAPSLLDIARRRAERRGWSNVQTVCADVCELTLPEPVDVVTFSYSLTMIPDWFAAIERAWDLLRPGGWLGVVDFYVARKYPAAGRAHQAWGSRAFWPLWFAADNVHLSPDHLPYLSRRFETVAVAEGRARVPYLPGLRVPYYRFLGRKPVGYAPGQGERGA